VDGIDPLIEPSEIVRVALVIFENGVANLADGPRKHRHGTMLLPHFLGGHKPRPGHHAEGALTNGQPTIPLSLDEVRDDRFGLG